MLQQEDEFLQKRILDLANQSYRGNQFTFTGFLSQGDLDLFYQMLPKLSFATYTLFGGQDGCDRQMLRFGSVEELGYEQPFPIVCIEIAPRLEKFAENLSHRDFLGALMHLGIDRSLLGDIQISGKTAYVFCHEKIAGYLTEQVDKIRHTNMKCRILEELPEAIKPTLREEVLIIPSLRFDGIVAKLYHISRSQSVLLFREKKIFVNGRCMENNSGTLQEGDVVSVRGCGKFVYEKVLHETKKGNLSVKVSRYV